MQRFEIPRDALVGKIAAHPHPHDLRLRHLRRVRKQFIQRGIGPSDRTQKGHRTSEGGQRESMMPGNVHEVNGMSRDNAKENSKNRSPSKRSRNSAKNRFSPLETAFVVPMSGNILEESYRRGRMAGFTGSGKG